MSTVTIIEDRFTDLQNAEKALAGIRDTIQQKTSENQQAEVNLARLDELITSQGDAQAMLDIIGVRSTIDGLKTHLTDLRRAEAGASARRDAAEADHLEARLRGHDIEGAMSDEQLQDEYQKLAEGFDKLGHGFLAKLNAHNEATKQLTQLGRKMLTLRGRTAPWDYSARPHISPNSILKDHAEASYHRYAAPALEQAKRQHWAEAEEHSKVLREVRQVEAMTRGE